MATIKAIEAKTVHQIQSGQVIVDLCSVVKELVENGLDAGATSIEIRFKNQGLDSIEVQDNGSGISRENYETIALKHYTSKLSTYSDLASLQTFGFRGEALSSLCALSKFTVTTCLASDAPKGSKLEFETSGKLRSTTVIAAQKGTTVTVEGLFHNLPVRRRELERNIKREWNRVIGVLNQYACIKTGLKFSVSQQPTKGKRMVLFSTKGNQTTRENIVNVFGAKTLAVLIPLDLKLELEPTNAPGQKWTAQSDDSIHEVHIKGHVSRPAHGEGRQTPDRQMFFVNGRPCGLPQFAKVFNEVYKSYNASQSPFIFADIQLDTHLYDVNVSPDKRTILLHDQARMLDNLRESLVALFESQDYALPTSQLSSIKSTPFKKPSISRHNTPFSQSGSIPSTSTDNSQRQSSASTIPNNGIRNDEDEDEDDGSGDENTPNSSTSKKVPAHDSRNHSLVSRWAERRSTSRTGTPSTTSKISEDRDQDATKEARQPVVQISKDRASEDDDDNLEDSTQDPPAETPSQETDFRTRLAELSRNKANRRGSSPLDEPPIPAVSTSSRVSDIKSSRVSSSASLKRSVPEVATITVGNHTVTSIIGSPSKKQRIEDNQGRDPSVRQRIIKESVTIPTFNGRLTQMFAAYSQSKQTGSSRLETTTKTEDVSEDSSASDASDASSEHLFVEGDDDNRGDEEDNEQDNGKDSEREDGQDDEDAASVQSKENEEITQEDPDPDYQPPGPEAEDVELQDDISPSSIQPSSKEHPDDQTEEVPVTKPDDTTGAAQEAAKNTSEETQKRTQSFIKGGTKKKDLTLPLLQTLRIDEEQIRNAITMHQDYLNDASLSANSKVETDKLDAEDAEEKLSLTISKSDFGKMRIIGQFNLGFILAVRPANADHNDTDTKGDRDDELFIIDQHATDEKYNFERLQANTIVQSQRLVQPKTLELTALEEEVIRENIPALEANGFIVSMDESGDQPVGSRCQLLSLPLSRETTFSLADLEELVSMLTDHQSASVSVVPRPSKVRKMFAMRACRSSVMIGKHLTTPQMQKLVRHMGELDKPWNCPHGRPTMRHLCGIGAWSEMGWKEGHGFDGEKGPRTNWAAYVKEKNGLE